MLLSRTLRIRGELGSSVKRLLDESKSAGTFKSERVLVSAQGTEIITEKGKYLNFCSNNYLGLSNNPQVAAAAKESIDSHGFGLSSVRFICGTQDIHKDLESKIAAFHDMEAAILFPSCFDANAGIFEALLNPKDAVFSDALNHASIIDGIRLCKAGTKERYNHLDLIDLEKKIQTAVETGPADQIRLIVSDGVFSMDGDIAPLRGLAALTEKFPNTYLMIDECHATGVLGKTGRGTPEYFGVKVDIINSTLGKALGGGTGGYTAGSSDVIELLRQKARPYLFSNSVAPAIVGASLKVMDILGHVDTSKPTLQDQLLANTRYFRNALNNAGLTILGADDCPIVPVLIGDANKSSEFAEKLLERGIYVVSFSYPVVPRGQARIRVQISSAHTKQQLQKAVASFVSVSKELGLLELYTSAAFEKHTETGRRLAQKQDDDVEWDAQKK